MTPIIVLIVLLLLIAGAVVWDEPRIHQARREISDSYEYERLYRRAQASAYFDAAADCWRYPDPLPRGHNPVCSCGCTRDRRWPNVKGDPISSTCGPRKYNDLMDA